MTAKRKLGFHLSTATCEQIEILAFASAASRSDVVKTAVAAAFAALPRDEREAVVAVRAHRPRAA